MKKLEVGRFAALLLDEFDILIANWHKRKKGLNHWEAKILMREAIMNVLGGMHSKKSGRPVDLEQMEEECEEVLLDETAEGD